MTRKPQFLGETHARAFASPRVARAYRHRPPYADEGFDLLRRLVPDSGACVLDLGCGTGYVARHLVSHVARVDALDVSKAMIEEGKTLPNGDHPQLRWMVGSAEEALLEPPYDLVTAGDSLHWMDWEVVLPRLNRLLSENAKLVILSAGTAPTPWDSDLTKLIKRYSINQNYEPYDLIQMLQARGLFKSLGKHETAPVPFEPSIEDYVESFHGRASFSRDLMEPSQAEAFDTAVRALVRNYQKDFQDETVRLELVSTVVWGKPLAPARLN